MLKNLSHPPPHPPPLVYKGMFGGWVRPSRPQCPLTVRLTSRLSKVIDWLVLGPLRTLSAALEVRGRLLCKSASFCTVATPGERCHPPPSPAAPALPLRGFTLGKTEEASIKAFLCRFSCLCLVKLCTFFMLNAGAEFRAAPPACC